MRFRVNRKHMTDRQTDRETNGRRRIKLQFGTYFQETFKDISF